ncbi:MAG TPA: alpha/beta hydrolase [Stellaceae bacterium]|jgi:acetyl esterase/lipase|nr:alpha/beta hydrolase [Stellaceae bacterium]
MAFSPASMLNAFTIWGKYRLTSGIAYAPGARHTLDVYAPAPRRPAAPVVVFFYGGDWQTGNKAIYRFLGAALASRGLVAIIPDYRVYPEVRFPGFLEDAASAVRWAHDHAAEYGGDPGRMVLMGHSAGGHIAAMLTYDPRWLTAAGLDPDRDLKGLVGLAGPYDFLPLQDPTLKIIFGPEKDRAATQPINFVEAGAPPAFLATGCDDHTVKPGNTTRLAARISEKGDAVTVKLYDGISHRMLIGAFAVPLRSFAPVLRDTVAFIDDVTHAPAGGGAPIVTAAPR